MSEAKIDIVAKAYRRARRLHDKAVEAVDAAQREERKALEALNAAERDFDIAVGELLDQVDEDEADV